MTWWFSCGRSGRRRRHRGEGPVPVGDVDGLVIAHGVGEAVPEHLEPAVAEGPQGRVVRRTTTTPVRNIKADRPWTVPSVS